MRALLLGSQSFLDHDGKVGIQYIAEGLAKRGAQVDYVSNASSVVDSFFPSRRRRFRRIWVDRGDLRGVPVADNLTEYGFRTPYPARKEVLRTQWQIQLYSLFVPRMWRTKPYDVCIHDTSNSFLFLPKINARHFIFRLSDLPAGFSYAIHSQVIDLYNSLITHGFYDEIWAVSDPLAEYARKLKQGNDIHVIPNGINVSWAGHRSPSDRNGKRAVFMGNIFPWVDLELMDKTAALLPEWTFDMYGPMSVAWDVRSPNLRYRGAVSPSEVPNVLTRYNVGLVPFKEQNGLIGAMERPLKFYEYLSAGLGIAASDVGSLRNGMRTWASFGKTPEEFARAIVEAAEAVARRDPSRVSIFLDNHSWDRVLDTVVGRLETLDLRPGRSPEAAKPFKRMGHIPEMFAKAACVIS